MKTIKIINETILKIYEKYEKYEKLAYKFNKNNSVFFVYFLLAAGSLDFLVFLHQGKRTVKLQKKRKFARSRL